MRKLNAEGLAEALRYATDWFAVYVEETNALNVYPVPDGDTGTNMHLTLQSVRRELDLSDTRVMRAVEHALSYGSLLGARGNSGVILSQLLKGFSEALRRTAALDPAGLASALKLGSVAAYKAVMKPVEGTILTISRAVAEGAAAASKNAAGLEEVLEGALISGRKALSRTPELLPELAKAGVVDAGGQGYLRILEGFLGHLRKAPLPEPPEVKVYAGVQVEHQTFGYCTEFLMREATAPIEKIREIVAPFGDSLLVVGAEGFVKGHIHTNEPDTLLASVARYGQMRRTKVEDMSEQHSEILSAAGASEVSPPAVGLVVVASGWGLAKAFRSLGARVVSGGQTQNPSVEDILEAIKSLPSPQVIVLPNNKNVVMAAEKAVDLARGEGRGAQVLSTTTLGQGLAAAVPFDPEGDPVELLAEMQRAADASLTLEVTYATRTAELGELGEVQVGQAIGLRDGKITVIAESVGDGLRSLLHSVMNVGRGVAIYEVGTLFHGPRVNAEEARALADQIEERYPDLELELHPGGPDLYAYTMVLE